MYFSHRAFAAALLAGTAATSFPAFAADATLEGARALADDLAAYVGRAALDSGFVTVMPDGDAYRVTLDVARLAGVFLPAEQVTLTVFENASFRTAPADGGLWRVDSVTYPSLLARFPGAGEGGEAQQIEYRFSPGGTSEGLFDPALGAFTSFSQTLSSVVTATELGGESSRSEQNDISMTATAKPATDGGVDLAAASLTGGFVQTMQSATMPPIRVDAEGLRQSFVMEGGRLRAALDLLAYVIAKGDPENLKADVPALKAAVRDVLPGFRRLAGDAVIDRMSVALPFGTLGFEQMRIANEFSGAVKDGRYALSLAVGSISLPPELAPPWGAALVPTRFDLTLAVEDVDLETPTALLLDRVDPAKVPPFADADGEEAVRAMFPDGAVHVALPESSIAGEGYDATIEGRFAISHPDLAPGVGNDADSAVDVAPEVEGTARISLAGLDAILAELQKAGDVPEVQQAIPALIFAKGLARTEDGRSVWQVDVAANGSVSVNGQMLVPPSR